MKTKDILKRIPNKEGAGYFTVYLPSMDKELKIRNLSVNDQKIISKLAVANDGTMFASESDLAKIALAENNCLNGVELDEIDVRDYFILCCALRKENYMDEFEVNYTCPQCEEEFHKPLDFDRIIKSATEYEASYDEAFIKTKFGEMKVTIGLPPQTDLIMLEMYYAKVGRTRDVAMSERYVDYIICCMESVCFKNDADEWEEAEDFREMSYLEKVGFIQEVESNIEQVSKLFNDIGLITSKFFYDIDCPNCGNKIPSFMDTSDFFVL